MMSDILHPFVWIHVSIWDHFPLPGGFPLACPMAQVFLWWILPSFDSLGKSLFQLNFGRYFYQTYNSGLTGYFVSVLYRCHSTVFWLAWFPMRSLLSFSYLFLCAEHDFWLQLPYDFVFITGFKQIDCDAPWCSFLHFSCVWDS